MEEKKKTGRLSKNKFIGLMEKLKEKLPEKELFELLAQQDLVEAATRSANGGVVGGGKKMGIYVSIDTVKQIDMIIEKRKKKGIGVSKNGLFREGIEAIFENEKLNLDDYVDFDQDEENEENEEESEDKHKKRKKDKKGKKQTITV